jgi:hypothetical protein
MCTAVAAGFFDKFVRAPMQIIFTPASESVTDSLDRQVGASRTGLLEASAAVFELVARVIEIVGISDELAC